MWRSLLVCLSTLILSLFAVSLAAKAQPTGKVSRIGCLVEGRSQPMPFLLEVLRVYGYVEGHHLFLECRNAETREQLPALAVELVTRQVDLLVTFGTAATQAAKQATTTIPIVFNLANDPVQSGLVASFAQPGGNLTGVVRGHYDDKMLEILKEAVPGIRRVAWTRRSDPTDPVWGRLVDAARGLGLEILDIAIQGPDDIEHFFAAARSLGADAVLVSNIAWFSGYLAQFGELTVQSRLPAIGFHRFFAEAGGLLSYAQMGGENSSRLAVQIDKILQGRQPADLPVERPMRFELVIN